MRCWCTGNLNSNIILLGGALHNFNVKESEFTELKLLRKVDQKYPSIRRMYLGIMSSIIIVIPHRYMFLLQIKSCAAFCNALIDSSTAENSGCKFQFLFTLVPDVNAIDLMQLEQDINEHDEIKGCTLRIPGLIKSSSMLTALFET